MTKARASELSASSRLAVAKASASVGSSLILSCASVSSRLASPRLWDATACWRETLTTIATALSTDEGRGERRAAQPAAPQGAIGHGSREGLLDGRELPRVALAPQRVLAEGRARPQEVRRAALLVPEVRGLLELVAQQRALRVLRLPAHEAQPRPQQRLVDDLDAVVAPRLRRRGFLAPSGGDLVPAIVSSRAATSCPSTSSAALRSGKTDSSSSRSHAARVPCDGHEVAEDLPHHPLSLGPDPLERRLRVPRERARHARRSPRRPPA